MSEAYILTNWVEMHLKCSEVNDKVLPLPKSSQLVTAAERYISLCSPCPNAALADRIAKLLR
jgi:hypothetical protein